MNSSIRYSLLSLTLVSLLVGVISLSSAPAPAPAPASAPAPAPAPASAPAPENLRHVVLFKFKDSSSDEDVRRMNDAFLALPSAIPEIKDFEWGINNSPEGLDQGFTHCYLITFNSEEDRDSVYLPHPAHVAFVEGLQPHLEKVFVVDYWAKDLSLIHI